MRKRDRDKIEIGTISFQVSFSREEAYAVIHKPTSKKAKELRRYFQNILSEGCKKMLATSSQEFVNKCKLPINKELTE